MRYRHIDRAIALHANVQYRMADFYIAQGNPASPHGIDTQTHLEPIGMEKWWRALGFATVNREVIEGDPHPPRTKMKRRKFGATGGQVFNLCDNRPANIIIRGAGRENHHRN